MCCTMPVNAFPEVPIHAVLGGIRLSGSTETVIPETVEGLRNSS